MVPTVTLLYGSITALLVGSLGGLLSLVRLRKGIFIGMEIDKTMHRMVRAHGNAAEWAPLMILLLLLLEVAGVASASLHALGGSIVAARVLHALGVYTKQTRISMIGATATYALVLGMAGWALMLHFKR